MGTPSYIAKQIGDDSYLTIYCQVEGYLHSLGATLAKHYNTPEQVDALLALGDLYSLGPELNPEYIPDTGTVTTAFERDYDWPGLDASVQSLDEMLEGETFVEYLYIYAQDNRWKYLCCTTEEMEVKDVAEALREDPFQAKDPEDPRAGLKAALRQFLVLGEAVQDDAPTVQM